MKRDLNKDWQFLHDFNDVNKSFEAFHSHLLDTVKNYTEEKTIKIPFKNVMKEPWLTKGIITANRKQLKLYREWLKNKNANTHDRYKQYRGVLKRIKRRQKHNYYTNLCERHKQNSKQLWRLINDVCGRNNDRTSSINHITINGIKEFRSEKISKEFAQHFTNIGKHLSNSTPISNLGINTYLDKI